MKLSLFLIFGLFAVQNAYSQILDYFTVQDNKIPKSSYFQEEEGLQFVKGFEISALVTVREYNYYLKSIRIDSTNEFYLSQLPSAEAIAPIQIEEYLKDYEYQNLPVLGVSWEKAINYCKWLSVIETFGEVNYTYRLPTVTEWLSAKQAFPSQFSSDYSEWSFASYDEGIFDLKDMAAPDYVYIAFPEDPPSMKRKVIMGNRIEAKNSTSVFKFAYHYQNKGYANCGFRVRRTPKIGSSDIKKYDIYAYFESDYEKLIHSNEMVVKCKLKDNLFHGKYSSMYENGKSKTIGFFVNNQRKGLWISFDKKGEVIQRRLYYDNLHFTYIRELDAQEYAINDFRLSKEDLRDSTGAYSYTFVHEEDVYSSKRIWRTVNLDSNAILKPNFNKFISLLKSSLKKEEITIYGGDNDEFKSVLEQKTAEKLFEAELQIDGLYIKEDHFLDRKRNVADVRIIGLGLRVSGSDKVYCWLYYPQIRTILAKIPVQGMGIEHLEDVFFTRQFHSEITKESSLTGNEMEGSQLEKEVYLIEYQNSVMHQ